MILKKPLSTEKSFNAQGKGIWSFLVLKDASKSQIKEAVEQLFGEKVATVNTSARRKKIRSVQGGREHTRRTWLKTARVTLSDKKAKLDLTKVKK